MLFRSHFDHSCSGGNYYCPVRNRQLREAGVVEDHSGLLLLGDVPDLHFGFCYHPVVTHSKGGLSIEYVRFHKGGLSQVSIAEVRLADNIRGVAVTDYAECLDAYSSSAEEALHFFSRRCTTVETKRASIGVPEAYRAAKSARFEFGEQGAKAKALPGWEDFL